METALVPTVESVSPKLTSLLSPKASYLMHGKGFSNLLINQHVSCKKVNQGNQIKEKEINFHVFDEIAIAEGCFNYFTFGSRILCESRIFDSGIHCIEQ